MQQEYRFEDDEINLADLVAVVIRRWRWIAGSVLLMLLMGIGYALLQGSMYQATTTLEIGQIVIDKTYQPIENPGAVKNRIQSYSLFHSRHFQGHGPDNSLLFSPKDGLRIEVPDKGNILQVSLDAPKESKACAFLEEINQNIIADHNRIFQQNKTQLHNRIEREKLAIQKIRNQINETQRQYKIKEIDLSNQISRLKDNFEKELKNELSEIQRDFELQKINLNNKKTDINGQIELLENEIMKCKDNIGMLRKKEKEFKERIDKTEDSKKDFIKAAVHAKSQASSDSAISLMLFNSEIIRVERYLDNLREKVLYEIPDQILTLDNRIKELNLNVVGKKNALKEVNTQIKHLQDNISDKKELTEIQIRSQQAEHNQAQTQLKQLEEDLKSKLDNLEASIEDHTLRIQELKTQLDNMLVTKVIASPQFAKYPSNPKLKLITVLSIFLGFFIGIFIAFLREFWVNNRDHIMGKEE